LPKYSENWGIEESNEYNRKWWERNKPKRKEYKQNEKARLTRLKKENPLEWIRATWSARTAGKGQRGYKVKFDDLKWPTHCPILGIEINYKPGNVQHDWNRWSIDRLDSSKGYVAGNVAVISLKANTIKSFGTAEEHERIAAWMRAYEADPERMAKSMKPLPIQKYGNCLECGDKFPFTNHARLFCSAACKRESHNVRRRVGVRRSNTEVDLAPTPHVPVDALGGAQEADHISTAENVTSHEIH
jgi:hypothetical protein